MALLINEEARDLVKAMLNSGVDTLTLRGSLFAFIDPLFFSALPRQSQAPAQLLSDINFLNDDRLRLADGIIPLQVYLENAVLLLNQSPLHKNIVLGILDKVNRRISGAVQPNLNEIKETQEVVIHSDDTLPAGFMEAGVKAGLSVVKLKIPLFQNSQPKTNSNGSQAIGLGTGWLLTPTLVMTNHHVVNGRMEGHPDAQPNDVQLQVKNSSAILDYNSENISGTELKGQSLEASNKNLDYAIIRIADSGRPALRRISNKLNPGENTIPVNIIQHPGGLPKRYAIRNNLVSSATDTDLRYFTDTFGGSSGSPVFNDQWETVALHKGAVFVENVKFQGKDTAFVNIGTHITSIMEDVKQQFPQLFTEINQ